MRRINFFMMAAIFAVSSVFVSCNKDEDPYIPKPAPEISVKFGGADVAKNATVPLKIGTKKTLEVSFVVEGGLKAIEFSIGTESPGVPVTPGATTGTFSIELEGIVKGNIPIAIKVTDNQAAASEGLPEAIGDLSDTFSFTVGVEENELENAVEFTLVYKGGSQTDGENINETVGIRYQQNLTASTARFVLQATENNFVPLTKAEFDGIKTKEALKAKYDADVATKGVDRFERSSDAAFQPYYFMSKVGSNYFLIEMKSLNFASGNNRAVFSYQK